MLVKEIKFVDYNGNERTENFYFNLNKAELVELECDMPGGIEQYAKRLVETQDNKAIMQLFKSILERSVGVKSLDGRTFEKGKEVAKSFFQTEAYSELLMELMTVEGAADKFIKAILPSEEAQKSNVVAIN